MLTTLVWLLFLILFHAVMDDVPAGYHRHFGASMERVDPPVVMKFVGLPILGRGRQVATTEHWLWYLARGVLVIPPLALLLFAWCASNTRVLDVIAAVDKRLLGGY